MAQGIKANISQEVLANLLNDYTEKEIAEQLNVSITTIKRYKTKYGLKSNPEITKQKNSEKHKKYSYDNSYFEKIDSLNKAYLLGFICADGFVTDRNEIGIGVSLKDREIVDFFQKELKSTKSPTIKEGIHPSIELRVQDFKIAQDLINLGVKPRKSLTLDLKEVIEKAHLSKEQISIFLLGYFDGDGCISLAHKRDGSNKEYFEINITGTYETILYFKQYFGHGTITKRHQDSNNNYTLQMSNNYSTIYNALKKLYQYRNQISFYYKRKYLLFEKLESKVLSHSDM